MRARGELVGSIAAHESTEAMFAFVSQISETFDANVVEALFAAPYYLGSADDETQSFLEGLGRDAAQGLRLKLAHRPPRLYRFFVTQLFGAYQQNQMLDLLRERISMVDTALAATVTVVLESLRARDELTDQHIHFAASLATRVEQLSTADHSVELEFVAADLCENLAALCTAGQDNDGQANMLRKVGLLRGARSSTLAAVYLRAALGVPDVSSELRIGLSCALAEQLIDARGDSGAKAHEAISCLKLAQQPADSRGASASVPAFLPHLLRDPVP